MHLGLKFTKGEVHFVLPCIRSAICRPCQGFTRRTLMIGHGVAKKCETLMFLILLWPVTQPVICFLRDLIKAEGPRVLETRGEDGETSCRPTPPPWAVYQVECKRTNSRSEEFGSQLNIKIPQVFAFQGFSKSIHKWLPIVYELLHLISFFFSCFFVGSH